MDGENGIILMEKESAPADPFPRLGRLAATETSTTNRPAVEQATYRVKEVNDDMVTIVKQSHLQTGEQVAGSIAYDQEVSGELKFDQKRGVMAEAELKLTNTYSQDNISVKVPCRSAITY